MYVRHLSLGDFRSYATAEVSLDPGVSTLIGLNGQGKTNLVEALGYLACLGSHRVSTDAPLVRAGAERAIVRAAVVSRARETLVELEINPGRANRARLGRAAVPRPRDILGTLRTVLFAPEDLALVKGDPGERRRYLDDLLIARQPRWAAVRADHERLLKQRGALLKSAAPQLRRGLRSRAWAHSDVGGEDEQSAIHTLDVWSAQLAQTAAPLLYARLRLVRDLGPHLARTYDEVSAGQSAARMTYRASLGPQLTARIAQGDIPSIEELHDGLLAAYAEARGREIDRGVNLVGPHRDELVLSLGDLPAKGYASHGESWSIALGLKLAAYSLLRHDLGDDPILILDDVFAELDVGRRERLAHLVADCEQVLITAAVAADVPEVLSGRTFTVTLGSVRDDDGDASVVGGSTQDVRDPDHAAAAGREADNSAEAGNE